LHLVKQSADANTNKNGGQKTAVRFLKASPKLKR
jgi:hypothetical protein